MSPSRILVVRMSSMGDVIHTLPAVANLKRTFPEARLTWLVRPQWIPLLEGNPYIDEIVPMRMLIDCVLALRRQHFDLAVDFQGLTKTAILTAMIGPKKLAGFDYSCVRERPAALFYSTRVKTGGHAVNRNLDLATGAGADNLEPIFPLPAGSPEGRLPNKKFVLVSPLAGWSGKQWPFEYWIELARSIDLPLVVNGPPDAAVKLSEIRGADVHLSGLPGLIYATRLAHAVIGVDSGPMHLAAALGKPGVAIFGPTNPERHGPYGGSLRVLRSPDASTSYRRVANPVESMRAISPKMVADALAASLESCPA